MKQRRLRAQLAVLVPLIVVLFGAVPPSEDPAHEALRTLRRQLVEAANKNDIDALMPLLDEDVVVTWMDGAVSHKPAGVREYLERMTRGPNRKVERFETKPEADELTHLYGDTGVVFGHAENNFVLTDGRELSIPTRWSATLVKKNGQWKLANFHASTDMFDNPVLNLAVRRTALWFGGGGLVVGLLLGFLLAWLWRRRRVG